jgi:hypothetical protein
VKTAAWSFAENACRPPALDSAAAPAPAASFGAAPSAGTAAIKPRRDIFFKVKPSLNCSVLFQADDFLEDEAYACLQFL